MLPAASIFEFKSPYSPYPYRTYFLSPFAPLKSISGPSCQITAFLAEFEAAPHHYVQPIALSAIFHSAIRAIDDQKMPSSPKVSIISS